MSGYIVPSLNSKQCGSAALFPSTHYRLSQRTVVRNNVYGTKMGRQYYIMIEAGETESRVGTDYIPIWFGKTLVFPKTFSEPDDNPYNIPNDVLSQ